MRKILSKKTTTKYVVTFRSGMCIDFMDVTAIKPVGNVGLCTVYLKSGQSFESYGFPELVDHFKKCHGISSENSEQK